MLGHLENLQVLTAPPPDMAPDTSHMSPFRVTTRNLCRPEKNESKYLCTPADIHLNLQDDTNQKQPDWPGSCLQPQVCP